ncbi:MAG: RES family NAD+ phosphorylase [Gammaproteobacteria bacterium]|nr:RES family NAD+ phosphorylase [Gammaproteobacteria bacterium]
MWTPTALASEVRPVSGIAWRVVENQHISSSRKLVDNIDEHDLLEEILEENKPGYLQGTEGLHYLLKTPFRYKPPKKHGSRFRRSMEKTGVFYCADNIRTALAEYTYHRLQFFLNSPGTTFPENEETLTVFTIVFSTDNGLNLMEPKLNRDEADWLSNDYASTHELALNARKADVKLITYQSCRDNQSGVNHAILDPSAFKSKAPTALQTWFLYLDKTEVNCRRAHAKSKQERIVFTHAEFQNR